MATILSTASSVSAFARSVGRAIRAQQRQGYAAFAAAATHNRAKLPDLPYGYADLEPVISGEIMELHHNGHHRAYVENYNKAVDRLVEAEGDVRGIVREQSAIRFNGGGHLNHSIFWTNLAPPKAGGGTVPIGALARAIDKQFGSFAQMVGIMTAASVAIKGSGWGWLAYDEPGKRLLITTTANQDPLTGLHPLLGIDVWEHAYYNQYKDVRLDYVENIWKVINWRDIESRYAEAIKT